jgi:hypothetical protein
MKPARPRSLQWLLVRRLVLLQAAMLAIFNVLCAAGRREIGGHRRPAEAHGQAGQGNLVSRRHHDLLQNTHAQRLTDARIDLGIRPLGSRTPVPMSPAAIFRPIRDRRGR